ncbi:MAG: hypothetical protein ACR2GX_01170 [Candidatus Dormibacteria bacterium]
MPPLTLAARIDRELRLRVVRRAEGPWTEVVLRQVHVPDPDDGGAARWVLTTERRSRLSPVEFDPAVAARVNDASREKGRAIYAVHQQVNEVVAAVSFHLPLTPSDPVVITALAPRTDALAAEGRACVLMLKGLRPSALSGSAGAGSSPCGRRVPPRTPRSMGFAGVRRVRAEGRPTWSRTRPPSTCRLLRADNAPPAIGRDGSLDEGAQLGRKVPMGQLQQLDPVG